jgi:hypothetical protein
MIRLKRNIPVPKTARSGDGTRVKVVPQLLSGTPVVNDSLLSDTLDAAAVILKGRPRPAYRRSRRRLNSPPTLSHGARTIV